MALFSERYGYTYKPIQFESISSALKNRIWNAYNCKVCTDIVRFDSHYMEEIMDVLGLSYKNVYNKTDISDNLWELKKWYGTAKWYEVYNFIEIYLNILPSSEQSDAKSNFNDVLQQENSGYRIVGTNVIPITGEGELQCIETAQKTAYESVNMHIMKATELFGKRPVADYENSIKESISAVESICCIITGASGKQATLGKTLKMLKERRIHIHPAMENAFSSLYGYTSDENGIRHGGIDFTSASAEDAKYMLVSCSAFVNYLIEKWAKINPKE